MTYEATCGAILSNERFFSEQSLDASTRSGGTSYGSAGNLSEKAWQSTTYPDVKAFVVKFEIDGAIYPTTIYGQTPDEFVAILRKVQEIASLPRNWNSYKANRVQIIPVKHCLTLLTNLLTKSSTLPTMSPTAAGGILIGWHLDNFELEIDFTPEGQIIAVMENFQTGGEWEEDIVVGYHRIREIGQALSQIEP